MSRTTTHVSKTTGRLFTITEDDIDDPLYQDTPTQAKLIPAPNDAAERLYAHQVKTYVLWFANRHLGIDLEEQD